MENKKTGAIEYPYSKMIRNIDNLNDEMIDWLCATIDRHEEKYNQYEKEILRYERKCEEYEDIVRKLHYLNIIQDEIITLQSYKQRTVKRIKARVKDK